MSYVRIWLHCVWGTKKRYPFLKKEIRQQVISHIAENAKRKNIRIDVLNGAEEHLHCLLQLSPEQSVSGVMQLIKGESSFWINKENLTDGQFAWAVDYYAVSVSDSDVERVRNYIRKQEEHHRKKSWEEEVDEFVRIFGFTRLEDPGSP